ncbi:hypothetical protein GCM10007860_31320 [Chitiniphilus shinanonensis]|uniref:NolW-like domain-containing protein n=1 Tax=Chitiniphilus shinanonensis TaxID=553088 RepID=A0ABQ6BW59_9NEIS|nr:secretin N-terminal domain-containing protein [Chitiniphilus shinanonensis]GLS05968.1 hypothetical protein GCM10007860_31320 [Chitiniphilus shinanonensis]
MKRLLACCLFALVAGFALAERLDVVPLQHRTAEDLAPVLRGAIPKASFQPMNNQLIVRSPDTATYQQVLDLLARIDQPARNLTVTVEQREGESRSGRTLALDGIGISNRGFGIGIRLFGGGSRSDSVATQSVRVLDGQHAFVRLGSERFYPSIGFGYRPGYSIVLAGGTWVGAGTGFWAEPRVVGDNQVLLRLYPESSRFEPDGSISEHSVYGEVRGQLGEWLPVGQSTIARAGSNQGTSGTSSSGYTVWVKVDPAP